MGKRFSDMGKLSGSTNEKEARGFRAGVVVVPRELEHCETPSGLSSIAPSRGQVVDSAISRAIEITIFRRRSSPGLRLKEFEVD